MDQNVKDYVIEKTNELIAAFSCSPETKEAAERWLAAVDTEGEAAETAKYIAELEADIMPIDQLIAFAGTEAGAKVFGAEKAREVKSHADAQEHRHQISDAAKHSQHKAAEHVADGAAQMEIAQK